MHLNAVDLTTRDTAPKHCKSFNKMQNYSVLLQQWKAGALYLKGRTGKGINMESAIWMWLTGGVLEAKKTERELKKDQNIYMLRKYEENINYASRILISNGLRKWNFLQSKKKLQS